jgi:hypothetical protein
MVITEQGVYEVPHAEYLADPVPGGSLSASGAKRLLPPSCPALFRHYQDHPPESTAVFDFGHAAHKLVLGEGAPLAVLDADDWRTKAAQDWRKAVRAEGSVPLLKAEHEQVLAMAAALRGHPIASALFDPERGGQPEQNLFWRDYGSDVWRRARLDWLPDWQNIHQRPVIGDYKTTVSADPVAAIPKHILNFGYHQQAAWYLDGVRELLPGSDPAFVFVFQEKAPPYLITVCELDDIAERAGRRRNAEAIERYRDCRDAGTWPGYSADPEVIELISLPPWAIPRIEEYA